MPSNISEYDLAVLRSTCQAFASADTEWARGAQAGMRAAAAILNINLEDEQ